jgi:putative transcriptional regulator
MPTVRVSRADVDLTRLRWTRTPPSDNAIADQIANDPDTAPAFTDAELSEARRIMPAPTPDEVRAIRRALGLSQPQFAARYGFSVETIRNYEQGHRRPTGPARVLLRVIAREPEAVARALAD